jgi:RNA methyltransferase, TrmH family
MLTSRQNPLVKQMRQLHQAKGRREAQQFLLEGTHLLQAAIAHQWPLLAIAYTPTWQQRQAELLAKFAPSIRVELVSDEVLSAMATTQHPDGVVAIATVPPPPLPTTTIQRLGLVLETIQDPGNLGTMIRTAAATGVEALLLSADCVDRMNPKVLRASAGAWFQVPIWSVSDLPQQLQAYQNQGVQLVATTPTASASYWSLALSGPTLVMIGNEGAGLSAPLLAIADHKVRIPLAPGTESLNAAIATALILYEAQRQTLP